MSYCHYCLADYYNLHQLQLLYTCPAVGHCLPLQQRSVKHFPLSQVLCINLEWKEGESVSTIVAHTVVLRGQRFGNV